MLKRLLMLGFLVLAFGLVGTKTVFGSSIDIGITTDLNDSEEDINPSKLGEIDADSSDLEMPYEDTGLGDPQFVGVRYELGSGKGVATTDEWVQSHVDEDKCGTLPVNRLLEGELPHIRAVFSTEGP